MRSVVAHQAIDPIEQELVSVAQFVPEKRYRKRQDYLAALMRAVCDLPDPMFDELSDEAADWSCQAVDAFKAGTALPDFEIQQNGSDESGPDHVPAHSHSINHEEVEEIEEQEPSSRVALVPSDDDIEVQASEEDEAEVVIDE